MIRGDAVPPTSPATITGLQAVWPYDEGQVVKFRFRLSVHTPESTVVDPTGLSTDNFAQATAQA
jgi:hypothetical protein